MELGREKNHYIAFGCKDQYPDDGIPEIIDAVNAQGGFGYLAHPAKRAILPSEIFTRDRWDVENFIGWRFGTSVQSGEISAANLLSFSAFIRPLPGCPFPGTGNRKWDTLAETAGNGICRQRCAVIPFRLGFITLAFCPAFPHINTHLLWKRNSTANPAGLWSRFEALRGNFYRQITLIRRGFRFSAFNGDEEVNIRENTPHSSNGASIISPQTGAWFA